MVNEPIEKRNRQNQGSSLTELHVPLRYVPTDIKIAVRLLQHKSEMIDRYTSHNS